MLHALLVSELSCLELHQPLVHLVANFAPKGLKFCLNGWVLDNSWQNVLRQSIYGIGKKGLTIYSVGVALLVLVPGQCVCSYVAYCHLREKVQIRIWRRPGRSVDRATAEHLFEVINSREDVLRRLIRGCAYLKYVEARLGDWTLHADEILKDGFCLSMIDTPLCPLKVITNLQEAVWDADIVINGLPSTETREVFEEISRYWKVKKYGSSYNSLAKGIEAELQPEPRIITPTQMISQASKTSFYLEYF